MALPEMAGQETRGRSSRSGVTSDGVAAPVLYERCASGPIAEVPLRSRSLLTKSPGSQMVGRIAQENPIHQARALIAAHARVKVGRGPYAPSQEGGLAALSYYILPAWPPSAPSGYRSHIRAPAKICRNGAAGSGFCCLSPTGSLAPRLEFRVAHQGGEVVAYSDQAVHLFQGCRPPVGAKRRYQRYSPLKWSVWGGTGGRREPDSVVGIVRIVHMVVRRLKLLLGVYVVATLVCTVLAYVIVD